MHHLNFSLKPALYNDLEKNNHLEKTFIERLDVLYSKWFFRSYTFRLFT